MAVRYPLPSGGNWRDWAQQLIRALETNQVQTTADSSHYEQAITIVNSLQNVVDGLQGVQVLVPWSFAIPPGWEDAGVHLLATPPGFKWIKRS